MVTDAPKRRKRVVYGVTVGASAYSLLRGQLRWMQASDWDVTLVCTPDDKATLAAEREGVALRPVPMTRRVTPWADLKALMKWIRLLRAEKPDAVNVSTPKAGLLGGLASFLLRVPRRLYVVRGLRLEGSSGPLAKLLWLMEWLTMKTATDVLFVSRSLAKEADRLGLLDNTKSWVIGAGSSNGVDSAAIEKRLEEVDATSLRSGLDIPADAVVVGFIGRLARDKGIETLVTAMRGVGHPDVILLVIGPSEDPGLDALVDSLGDRVRRVPWTDDVWGHLKAIDILCLPTLREGFPNVVLEAGAASIPAITTRATGAIDSVIDGKTGLLVDVGDFRALSDCIEGLVADPAARASMGAAARRRVSQEFQGERIWQGLSTLLSGERGPLQVQPTSHLLSLGDA